LVKPKILIISVGGTISSASENSTVASPKYDGEEIVRAVPKINDLAEIRVQNFSKVLSSQLSVDQIYLLCQRINEEFNKDPELTGIVVTHGTGAMEESSFMADLMVSDERPVVFTGAMRHLSNPFTDGYFNLYNAVQIAVSSYSRNKGVMVALNGVIHPARDVYKSHTTGTDTFNSGEFGPIGYVYPDRIHISRETTFRPKVYTDNPSFNIDLIKFVVGMDDRFIKSSIEFGAEGIVIEGSGLGNVNESLANGINLALEKGITVVISTRCSQGRVFPSYGTKAGAASLSEMGCILTSLQGPKARMMLMLALGATKSFEELQQLFDPLNEVNSGDKVYD
jgi:L-asparaginase